jgi:hypothetical protein
MAELYVVLEFNQASGQPEGQYVEPEWSLEDARLTAQILTQENRNNGRRETYRIFELLEIEEDG